MKFKVKIYARDVAAYGTVHEATVEIEDERIQRMMSGGGGDLFNSLARGELHTKAGAAAELEWDKKQEARREELMAAEAGQPDEEAVILS